MPVIHKSTIKRARQAVKRQQRNRAVIGAVRGAIKKVQSAIEENKADAAPRLLRSATAVLSKAVSKGVMKRNTASRRISRLARQVNAVLSSRS